MSTLGCDGSPERLANLAASEKQVSAMRRQVGGRHYADLRIQPAEYCVANRIPKLEGDVIYYVTRWRAKGGVTDLRKAIHSIELLIELSKKYDPIPTED